MWIVPLIAFLAGCGKSEAPKSASPSAADYPLPDPPLVSNCEPGVRGGRLVIASFAGAKTFNPRTETEQSSMSHALTLSRPLRLREIAPRTFALDGTPADCVS